MILEIKLFARNRNNHFPVPAAVQFNKKNALLCPKLHMFAGHRNRFRSPQQKSFNVGVAVAAFPRLDSQPVLKQIV